MKRCKIGTCPKYQINKCCAFCDEKAICTDCCPNCDVKCAVCEEVNYTPAEFEQKEIALINTITEIEKQKALLTKQSDQMRETLLQLMEEYNVKSFNNDILSVTYIAPTTRTSIDSTKLKKELPDVAEKYTKISNVKASIKIKIKEV